MVYIREERASESERCVAWRSPVDDGSWMGDAIV